MKLSGRSKALQQGAESKKMCEQAGRAGQGARRAANRQARGSQGQYVLEYTMTAFSAFLSLIIFTKSVEDDMARTLSLLALQGRCCGAASTTGQGRQAGQQAWVGSRAAGQPGRAARDHAA